MSSGLDKLCESSYLAIGCSGTLLKGPRPSNNNDYSSNTITPRFGRPNGICIKTPGSKYCLNNYALGIFIAIIVLFTLVVFFLNLQKNKKQQRITLENQVTEEGKLRRVEEGIV